MADPIFQRAGTKLAGVFSADVGRLSFGKDASTALVQSVNGTFMQNITRLYEVGQEEAKLANVYYVGGRSQGNLAIARVIGPAVLISAFYRKFGDVCHANTNTIELDLNAGLCFGVKQDKLKYSCQYCVITQLGFSVGAQDMIVNEQSALMFSNLDFTGP